MEAKTTAVMDETRVMMGSVRKSFNGRDKLFWRKEWKVGRVSVSRIAKREGVGDEAFRAVRRRESRRLGRDSLRKRVVRAVKKQVTEAKTKSHCLQVSEHKKVFGLGYIYHPAKFFVPVS